MAGHAILLRGRDGQQFHFDAGSLCIEFALTGGEGLRAHWEVLHTPAHLRQWLAASQLAADAPCRTTDLAAARRLREAVFALTLAAAHRDALDVRDIAVVNEFASRPPLVAAIEGRGRRGWRRPTAAAALSSIARDAVGLFGGPGVGRVRECAAADCRLLFVDTSRPGRRRWCSMERCGNRAKIRALRGRAWVSTVT